MQILFIYYDPYFFVASQDCQLLRWKSVRFPSKQLFLFSSIAQD